MTSAWVLDNVLDAPLVETVIVLMLKHILLLLNLLEDAGLSLTQYGLSGGGMSSLQDDRKSSLISKCIALPAFPDI